MYDYEIIPSSVYSIEAQRHLYIPTYHVKGPGLKQTMRFRSFAKAVKFVEILNSLDPNLANLICFMSQFNLAEGDKSE